MDSLTSFIMSIPAGIVVGFVVASMAAHMKHQDKRRRLLIALKHAVEDNEDTLHFLTDEIAGGMRCLQRLNLGLLNTVTSHHFELIDDVELYIQISAVAQTLSSLEQRVQMLEHDRQRGVDKKDIDFDCNELASFADFASGQVKKLKSAINAVADTLV